MCIYIYACFVAVKYNLYFTVVKLKRSAYCCLCGLKGLQGARSPHRPPISSIRRTKYIFRVDASVLRFIVKIKISLLCRKRGERWKRIKTESQLPCDNSSQADNFNLLRKVWKLTKEEGKEKHSWCKFSSQPEFSTKKSFSIPQDVSLAAKGEFLLCSSWRRKTGREGFAKLVKVNLILFNF